MKGRWEKAEKDGKPWAVWVGSEIEPDYPERIYTIRSLDENT